MTLLTPATGALLCLMLSTPICLWVLYTDLKYMKIRNAASLLLIAIFALCGLLFLPFEVWAWRWLHMIAVFGLGLVLNHLIHFGMGDVKFSAAASLFIAPAADAVQQMLLLFSAATLASILTHGLMRKQKSCREMAPDWVSWNRRDFPLGVPLALTLWGYLLLSATA